MAVAVAAGAELSAATGVDVAPAAATTGCCLGSLADFPPLPSAPAWASFFPVVLAPASCFGCDGTSEALAVRAVDGAVLGRSSAAALEADGREEEEEGLGARAGGAEVSGNI